MLISFRTAFLVACLSIVPIAQADEGIYLNFDERPEQHTRTVTNSSNEMEINAMGDPQFIEQLAKNGRTFPLRMKSFQTQKLSSRSGKADVDGTFEFVRTFEDAASFAEDEKGKRISLPSAMDGLVGLAMKGKVDRSGKIIFVSVEGPGVDEEKKKLVAALFNQLGTSLKAPTGPIKIGDSFTTETPLDIPMPTGVSMKFDMRSRYTLRKVENDRAMFDITSDFTMVGEAKATITGNGSGSGSMVYNIKTGLRERTEDITTMKMVIQAGQAVISTSTTASSTVEQYLINSTDSESSPSNLPNAEVSVGPVT